MKKNIFQKKITDSAKRIFLLGIFVYFITLPFQSDAIDETDNEYSRAITIEARGDEEVQFLSLTTDIGTTLQAGDQITFIASCKGAGPIYYQFFYRAGYGTAAYDGNPWVIMQEFSTSNTCTYSFPNADNYVVVVWACNDPNNIPDDVPLMGINLKVKSQ